MPDIFGAAAPSLFGNLMLESAAFTDLPTVWIPLPDGVRLAARIWLPGDVAKRPAPAVLECLPYRRRDGTCGRDEALYPGFARAGIAGVRVDMRGTGDSDGLFDDEYSETELADAEAVIAWIAAQEWCNGNVGMMGISWGGFNALQVAARAPKALRAVISIASTVDRFADDIHYKGGAQLSAQLNWANQMLGRNARPPDADVVGDAWRKIWLHRLENAQPLINPWLTHQRRDDYWRHGSICEDFSALKIPALMIAGCADGYRNTPWKALAGLGGATRAVTGPWVHLYPHFALPRPRMDFPAEATAWWQHWLGAGAEPDLPAHRVFVSEAVRPEARERDPGRWVALERPLPDPACFTLGPGALQSSPCAEQALPIRTPQDCGADGGIYFAGGIDQGLPGDQRHDDALSACFETPPLTSPLEVIGRPRLRLPVALDAPQGNLVARLVDVHPDGTAHRVSIGVLNLSHRDDSAHPRPMMPGHFEAVEIALDMTAYRFRTGHRLRLALSTSYFPLILPPPTAVTATIMLGPRAQFMLPRHVVRDIAVPEIEAAPIAYPRSRPAQSQTRILRCGPQGRTSIRMSSDSGRMRHPEYGIEWQERARSQWVIAPDDPSVMNGMEYYEAMRLRDGIETCVSANASLRASASHWHITTDLNAAEDGRTVFARQWSFDIPRDHM